MIKPSFLQVEKKGIFSELVQNSAYNLNMRLSGIFDINQDIIQVYNNKDIKLLSQYLINVFLEGGWSIRYAKKHDLIFEMTVSSFERYFLFIVFTNSH